MPHIELTKGYVSVVDEIDFDIVKQYKWYADVGPWTIYAKNDWLVFRPRLYVFIMKPPPKLIVHHKDGNGLNNLRENLEVITQAEHSRLSALRRNKNSEIKYRGVYKHRKGYVAEFWFEYKKYYLGKFSTQEEAAIAYNTAASSILGNGFIPNEIK